MWSNVMLPFCLSFIVFVYSFLFYVLGVVTNPLKQSLTSSSVCYIYVHHFLKITRFLRKLWFLFWNRLFLKYFKNNFKINILKIFFNCNSFVYFENILVCNKPFIAVNLFQINRKILRKVYKWNITKITFNLLLNNTILVIK